MGTAGMLATLIFLAGFNEWVVEHLFGQWRDGTTGHSKLGKGLVYISAALGIAECVMLRLNALSLVGVGDNTLLGQVVAGIVVGAGSNVVHKFFGNSVRK